MVSQPFTQTPHAVHWPAATRASLAGMRERLREIRKADHNPFTVLLTGLLIVGLRVLAARYPQVGPHSEGDSDEEIRASLRQGFSEFHAMKAGKLAGITPQELLDEL